MAFRHFCATFSKKGIQTRYGAAPAWPNSTLPPFTYVLGRNGMHFARFSCDLGPKSVVTHGFQPVLFVCDQGWGVKPRQMILCYFWIQLGTEAAPSEQSEHHKNTYTLYARTVRQPARSLTVQNAT